MYTNLPVSVLALSGPQIVLIAVVALIVIFAVMGVKIIRQSETMVIERLGRYHRTLQSGMNIIWPIIDQPRLIHWRHTEIGQGGRTTFAVRTTSRIDLREAVYDYPKYNVITRDNVSILIDALVYFQINDAMRSIYEIDNLPNAIEKLTQTTLRNLIGELDFDECLVSRDAVNKKLGATLDEATHKWGVKVNRVEIKDIIPPADVQAAMEKQMRAERDRRALILTAEGAKQSAILEAEGVRSAAITTAEGAKQAEILRAEGQAFAIERVAQAQAAAVAQVTATLAGGKTDPATYLIAQKYIETIGYIASGQNNKIVYLPYEATALLGSLGGIKELFGKTDNPGTGTETPGYPAA